MTDPPGPALAAEFGLAAPRRVDVLSGGGPHVWRVVSGDRAYVVKPAPEPREAELYALVADVLEERGIRQARPQRTLAGSLVSRGGHCVYEWLPGRIDLPPVPAQARVVMRHLADYHAALSAVPAPTWLARRSTLWQDVTSPAWLVANLPALLDTQAGGIDPGPVLDALARVADAAPSIGRLQRQVVHGDVGPDNVLMDQARVVAIIDFTPFDAPALFGLATALYWYHVRRQAGPLDPPPLDVDALAASIDSYAQVTSLTVLEAETWPAMLVCEALRRLATTLALRAATGVESVDLGRRYRAVEVLAATWVA